MEEINSTIVAHLRNMARQGKPPSRLLHDLILALNRPEDLALLETVFRECEPAGSYLTLEETISFLDDRPDLRDSNKPYVRKATRCDIRLDPERLARASLASCNESRRVS